MQSPSETRSNTHESMKGRPRIDLSPSGGLTLGVRCGGSTQVAGLHGDPIHRIEALLLGDSRAVNSRIWADRSAQNGDFST